MASIEFDIRPLPARRPEAVMSVMPVVDGEDFAALVECYESSMGFSPSGGYEGIVPALYRFGDLSAYYVGEPDTDYWVGVGRIAVLGCDCGEVGCWPFYVDIGRIDDEIVWAGYAQPHRPDRDYTAFGEFRFALAEYGNAVTSAIFELESTA